MMGVRTYEMPWRTAHEAYAAIAWSIGVGLFAVLAYRADYALAVPASLAVMSLAMAAYRWRQALRLLVVRASLSGRAMETLSTAKFRVHCRQANQVFLGFGFEWRPVHSQRLYELSKIHFRDFVVSHWLLRVLGYDVHPQPEAEVGLPYIHGVEPREQPLHRPLINFEGGTIIVGTTQSGKGVTLSVLASQAVYRGDVVIIIDPKKSKRLKSNLVCACQDAGRADACLEFHPAFPERGVRFDPLFNWQKPTELASRIQSVMPPDTTGSFSAFGWDAVNVVVQGMVELEDRPNLAKLAQSIEGGIEPLLLRSLERHFDAEGPAHWREAVKPYIRRAAEGKVVIQCRIGVVPSLKFFRSHFRTGSR